MFKVKLFKIQVLLFFEISFSGESSVCNLWLAGLVFSACSARLRVESLRGNWYYGEFYGIADHIKLEKLELIVINNNNIKEVLCQKKKNQKYL
jgi:hypothetical protein